MKQAYGPFVFNSFCYLWYDTVPRQGKRVTEYDVIEYSKNMISPSYFEIITDSGQYTNDMKKKYRHEPNGDTSYEIRHHRSIPLMMTGLFKTPNGWEPMGTGTYHYYNFFTHKPKEPQKLKGIYQSILDRAIQNERSKGYNLNTENFSDDIICNYNVGNLSIAQIKNLYVNTYKTLYNDNCEKKKKPKFYEQLELLGVPDLSQDLFNSDGSIRGASWSIIKLENNCECGHAIKRTGGQFRITGDNWAPNDPRVSDEDLFSTYRELSMNSNKIKQFLISRISLKQLDCLKEKYDPFLLNSMMGYHFGIYDESDLE